MSRPVPALAVTSLLLTLALAGCHVTSHKNGPNDDVNIGTPFGSMQVKTNDKVATAGIGLTPYPGAELEKKSKGHDSGAADVNMSFGSFHLGVKAASYISNDTPEQVLAFYRNDLKKFGGAIQCDGQKPVGEPTRTPDGLTCTDGSHKSTHIHINSDDDNEMQLKAGSKQHQHIVAVERKDGHTKIGLVALDLPGNLSTGDHNDRDSE